MAGTRNQVEGLPWYRAARGVGVGVDDDAMDQIDTGTLVDRARCVVTEDPANATYEYDQDSAAAADGFNVVIPASGVGRWILVSISGSAPFVTQAAWYVNAATGDDANDGATALTALLTLAELYRRTQGRVFVNDTTVWLSGDFSGEQLALAGLVAPGKSITVRGDVAQTHAGTFSAFTAWNPATAQVSVANDGTATSYAGLVGHFVRMTSGPASGYSAPIVKAVAAGQCRPGLFMAADGLKATPAAGNTFVVENVTTRIGGVDLGGLVGNGGSFFGFVPRVLMRDLEIYSPPQDLVFGSGAYIGTYLYRVRFGGSPFAEFVETNVTLIATYNVPGMQLIFRAGTVFFYGHCNAHYLNFIGGHAFWSEDLINQGGGMGVAGGGQIIHTAANGFFDVAASDACLSLEQGGNYSASQAGARIWGSGNTTTHGIRVRTGCTLEYVTKPTVAGTNDTIVGGTVRTYAQIPYAETNVALGYGAAIVPRA